MTKHNAAPTLNKMLDKAFGLTPKAVEKTYTLVIWISGYDPIGTDFTANGSPAAVRQARSWAASKKFRFMSESRYVTADGTQHGGYITIGDDREVPAYFQLVAHAA